MQRHAILIAAAFFAAPALAQNTQITFEGSYDQGLTWQGGTIPYFPGSTLEVRARISLVNAGSNTVLGLAGITFQPKLTNFIPSLGDTVIPFSSPDGSGVPENPQSNLGRILPFASSGMGTGSASGLLTWHYDPGNVLRFAGAVATTPGSNWGVSSGQVPSNLANPPSSFRTGTDAVVFRYAVQLNSVGTNFDWTATVDLATILQARGSWYRTASGTGSLLASVTQDTIIPLRIVVPEPGVLILMPIAVAMLRRRRAF